MTTATSFTVASGRPDTDFLRTLRAYRVWNLLALQDVRQRYRRSVLGPFWISLSAVVSIVALALVYTNIFNVAPRDYLAFLTTGFVCWFFLSGLVADSCSVFTQAESIVKQVDLPLGTHVMRMIWRNLIVFGHNLVIVALVLLYLGINPGWHLLWLLPAFGLYLATSVSLGYLLGALCTRFRDIPPIIASLLQVLFYVTPVIWPPRLLKGNEHLLDYNPFFHYLEVLRAPMLGETPSLQTWCITASLTAAISITAWLFMRRYAWRVAYWI